MSDQVQSEKSIFLLAIEMASAGERAAYLEQACAGNRRLRGEVEALLRAHEAAQPVLDAAAAVKPTIDETSTVERAGTIIGPYKLLEQIGEGGFGVVFMAEQQEPIRRKVALKVLKPGMDSRQVIARFEAERQALALMDHPNIARVLDAGTIGSEPRMSVSGPNEPLAIVRGSGRPYFVMELVKGIPITDYCDQNRLPPRERLELYLHVCQAVQHAHQKGIIHRDIKPSNVLVTLQDGKPLVKVIDFGIAKALGQQLTDKTLFTGFAQLVGTPLYMSPEQAALSNMDVDTRSDIYSLGVLLYELLTGTTPFDKDRLKEVGFDELRRIIREEEPVKPSTRISTLGQVASTISSNRQSDPQRLSKVFRGELDWIVMKALEKDRNRRYETASAFAADVERYLRDEPVQACPPSAWYRLRKLVRRNRGPVLAAVLVLLVLLGGIVGTTVGMVQAQWAQEAEAERAKSEEKAKLDAEDAADGERNAKLKAQDAARAEKRANEKAQQRLKQIEKGIEILASVFHNLDPQSEDKEGVSLRVLLGQNLGQAVKQLDAAAVGDPVVVARLQLLLGRSLVELGYYDQGEVVLTRARPTLESALGPNDADTLSVKHHLAFLYQLQEKHPLAESLLQEVLRGRTATLGAWHHDTLTTKNSLAVLYRDQGKDAQAETLYEQILAVSPVKLGAAHPLTLTAKHNLALFYHDHHKYAEAERLYNDVLAVRTATLGADHPQTLTTKHNLAGLYESERKYAEAESLYKNVLEARIAKLGAAHPQTLLTRHNLAVLYQSMRKLDDSIRLLEAVAEQAKRKLRPEHPLIAQALANLGVSYREANRREEGIRCLEDALAAFNKLPGRPPAHLAWIPLGLAQTYDQAKQPARSEPLYRQLVDQARQQFGAEHLQTADALHRLGGNLLNQNKWSDAEAVWRECLAIRHKKQPEAWYTCNARTALGRALVGQKKFAEAEPLLLKGYEGAKQHAAQMPPAQRKAALSSAVRGLIRLYENWGQPDQAAKWRTELEAIKKNGR
jgi:serine/threonine protein kinase